MVYEWKDKTVVVTGGAMGIGAAIVRMVAAEGAKYVALLDIAESQAKALKDELNAKYGKKIIYFHKCDVSLEVQIADVFNNVVKECGYIDVLINNAGILNDSLNMFRKQIEINYIGLVSMSLKAFAMMRKDEGGRGGTIINVSSIAALRQSELCPVYDGTKSAVLQFSLSLGMEEYYKRTGVRVIAICFGSTQSNILDKGKFGSFDKKAYDLMDELIATTEFQPTEIAARGVCDAFTKGETASTWLVINGQIKDITKTVRQAY